MRIYGSYDKEDKEKKYSFMFHQNYLDIKLVN